MSDSPTNPGSETFLGPTKVLPRHVNDPTILDSVAGFINEVVPTAQTAIHNVKDQILWARFEEPENDRKPHTESFSNAIPGTLVLVLGYATGIQVWAIPANGEATEILSWRHGYVKVLKFLPAPHLVGNASKRDAFASKRPLLAICDSSSTGPQFSSLNFVSLKTGEQVKVIKFKNSVLDVLANKQSVVVTFQEKIAAFDAFTLEDHMTVTTCYLSPGLNPNPVSLGARWLAYAEKKANLSKRSSGGMDGDGVQSYTATVIHAAKSLGRGLRELGESVANSLTGSNNFRPGTSPNSPQAGGQADVPQNGVVTILDIGSSYVQSLEKPSPSADPVVAHFTAHAKPLVALQFDPSGALLLTADKSGHDFHLFRIQPHPGGSNLAAVHHLYVLHRGDTSATVQDVCFSADSRWASVSTLRGTTHVFPVTPYGGNVGMRTHATSHVVNKMSRFHRSAGLSVDGRSNSPISMLEAPSISHFPYHNPRLPPFPHPTVVHPLAQIRQPILMQNAGNTAPSRPTTGRQRLPSSSEENVSLRVVTYFATPRAFLDVTRDASLAKQPRPVDSLFIVSCHGTLVQYDLDPHQLSHVPKERVSGDTPIELTVTRKAQWLLQRKTGTSDLVPPMTKENLSYVGYEETPISSYDRRKDKANYNDEHWLSQVEIITHAGPHRRLWMGPQFTFKTYQTVAGSPLSLGDAQPIDLGHSKPINMPITKANAVLIESSSASSCEQSLLDNYHRTIEEGGGIGELQLKEDLADAMLESPGIRDTGGRCVIVQMKPAVAKVVNPLGTVVNVHSDDDEPEPFEEPVRIHENRDETLFRPVVAPKAHHHSPYVANILTKSLETATEVAVNILNKPLDINDNDRIESNEKRAGKTAPIIDLFDVKTPPEPLLSLDRLDIELELEKTALDNDGFFSLENLVDEEPPKAKFERLSETTLGAEEEKAPRRARKPKPKLGVKIVNVEEPPARKSWSNVAASKPANDEPLLDFLDDDPPVIGEERAPEENEELRKGSDEAEEKGESSGSPGEATESDDSGKVPDTGALVLETKVAGNGRNCRRKKKRK
ncbi:unnamed protein product [Phyllotreta striolata]|uniref:BCAS3 domain-containing protein n=1 Tax=Phyllotreta striolata TaxID=444603 RepID=A0A9N9TME8_PHYSR|nr:unnamed protein product [Phyllotreta striolata]